MKANTLSGQAGFTLIETMMAMAIFTIGILGLFGMQTAAIKENLAANNITTGSVWATYQVEQLLGLDYTNSKLAVTGNCASLPNWSSLPASNKKRDPTTAGVPPIYTVYWAVAKDCTLTSIPTETNEKQEQKPKHLRITVTVDNGSSEVEVARFNYMRQNVKEVQ